MHRSAIAPVWQTRRVRVLLDGSCINPPLRRGVNRSSAMATSAGPDWPLPPTYEMATQLRQRNKAKIDAPPPDAAVSKTERGMAREEWLLTLTLFSALALAWIHHEQQLLAYLSVGLLACLAIWLTNTIFQLRWLVLEQTALMTHLALHVIFARTYGSVRDDMAVTLLSCVAPTTTVYLHLSDTKRSVGLGSLLSVGIGVSIVALGDTTWPHIGSLSAAGVLSALRLFDVFRRKKTRPAPLTAIAPIAGVTKIGTLGRYTM